MWFLYVGIVVLAFIAGWFVSYKNSAKEIDLGKQLLAKAQGDVDAAVKHIEAFPAKLLNAVKTGIQDKKADLA